MSHSKYTSEPFISLLGSNGAPSDNDTIGASTRRCRQDGRGVRDEKKNDEKNWQLLEILEYFHILLYIARSIFFCYSISYPSL